MASSKTIIGIYEVNGKTYTLSVEWCEGGKFWTAWTPDSCRDYRTRAGAVNHLKRTHKSLGVPVNWLE